MLYEEDDEDVGGTELNFVFHFLSLNSCTASPYSQCFEIILMLQSIASLQSTAKRFPKISRFCFCLGIKCKMSTKESPFDVGHGARSHFTEFPKILHEMLSCTMTSIVLTSTAENFILKVISMKCIFAHSPLGLRSPTLEWTPPFAQKIAPPLQSGPNLMYGFTAFLCSTYFNFV